MIIRALMVAALCGGSTLGSTACVGVGADRIRRLYVSLAWSRRFTNALFGDGALAALSEVAVVSLVNGFGSGATVAYGAVNQMIGYVLAPVQGVGVAATVFAAQAVGGTSRPHRRGDPDRECADHRHRAQDVLLWLAADPVTQSIAWRALLIALWNYVLVGVSNVLAGVMRATGTVLCRRSFRSAQSGLSNYRPRICCPAALGSMVYGSDIRQGSSSRCSPSGPIMNLFGVGATSSLPSRRS